MAPLRMNETYMYFRVGTYQNPINYTVAVVVTCIERKKWQTSGQSDSQIPMLTIYDHIYDPGVGTHDDI